MRRFDWLIVLVLLAVACTAPRAQPPAPTAGPGVAPIAAESASTSQPIVIGGTLGLTGALSSGAAVYKAIYDLWLEDVNNRGGILGRPVRMVIYDDESNPSTAQTLYQRLLTQDRVDLVLAPFSTQVGGAIIPIVQQHRKVLWNGGFVGIELFRNSRWMVGAYTYQEPDYPRPIFELIDSLPSDQRPRRIGVATAQNPFTLVARRGFEGYGGVENFAKQRGMEIVFDQEYPQNTNDLSGVIQRAKAANIDAFFALSWPNDGALMARTAHDLGFKPKIYCACGSQITVLPTWRDLGVAGEGVMSTTMAWPTDNYRGIKELYARLRDRLNYPEMPAYATVALTILQVMEQAITATNSLDQERLFSYVINNKFDTANGPLTYDQSGMPNYNAIAIQYLNAKNEVVWPPGRATAKALVPMPTAVSLGARP